MLEWIRYITFVIQIMKTQKTLTLALIAFLFGAVSTFGCYHMSDDHKAEDDKKEHKEHSVSLSDCGSCKDDKDKKDDKDAPKAHSIWMA